MFSHSKYPSQTVEELRKRISGTIITPADKEYDAQRKAWLDVMEQRPSVIINAASTEDIVEAIRTARELELPLGVQNTGHGIAAPCNEGILLRLGALKEISIDPSRCEATFGPGVVSGELLAAAETHGLAYPSGQVSSVGVIGYTIGGGFGWLGRKLGAACTTVRSATVVLADGSVLTADQEQNTDLFWAIRGGGGNFGVVASLTVELAKLPQVFGGVVYYRFEDAPEVLRFYKRWSTSLSEETSTYLRLANVPPTPRNLLKLRGTKACVIGICHADPATSGEVHDALRGFKKPVIDELGVRPYSEMASFDQASGEGSSSTFSHVECLRDLDELVMERVVEIATNSMPPLVLIEIQALGGALARHDNERTAYTAPTASFYFKIVSPTISAELEVLALKTKEAVRSLGPVFTGEISYNWMRGDQQTKVATAFGEEKYKALQAVKAKYDPHNLFHLNLNVAPLVPR